MRSFKKIYPSLLLALPMAFYTQFALADEVDGSDVLVPRVFSAQTEMVIEPGAQNEPMSADQATPKKIVKKINRVAKQEPKIKKPIKTAVPKQPKIAVKTDIEKMLDKVGLGQEIKPIVSPRPKVVNVKKPVLKKDTQSKLPEKTQKAKIKVVKKAPQVIKVKKPVLQKPTTSKKGGEDKEQKERASILARAVDRAVKAPLQPQSEQKNTKQIVAVKLPEKPQSIRIKKPEQSTSVGEASPIKKTAKPTIKTPSVDLLVLQQTQLERAVLKASAMTLSKQADPQAKMKTNEPAKKSGAVRVLPPPTQSSLSQPEKKNNSKVDVAQYATQFGDRRLSAVNAQDSLSKPRVVKVVKAEERVQKATQKKPESKNIRLQPHKKKAVLAGLGNKEFKKSSTKGDLKRILQTSLVSDPVLAEARAKTAAAKSRADGSFALHYPTVSVYGNQLISEKKKNQQKSDKDFQPGVTAKWNLFSWGAINNQVKRDEEKERYFYYKYYESREELGFEIASEYLRVIHYQESLDALKKSLKRHQKIMSDLRVIAQNDTGRRSELVQAQAREVQVRQSIANYQSNLDTSLNRLSKYTGEKFLADQLSDPFSKQVIQPILAFKRVDNMQHPTYMAQKAELQSVQAEMKSNKGKQFPAVNVEANANNDDKQVFLNLSWNIFDRATSHTVDASAQEMVAAESRLDQVFRDINERTRTASRQMEQSVERIKISDEQVRSTAEVAHAYELQFKIARKTLIELLNAYNDLASVELAHVNARNDFRVAALSFLHAQNQIAAWAGVSHSEQDTRYEREIGLLSKEKK